MLCSGVFHILNSWPKLTTRSRRRQNDGGGSPICQRIVQNGVKYVKVGYRCGRTVRINIDYLGLTLNRAVLQSDSLLHNKEASEPSTDLGPTPVPCSSSKTRRALFRACQTKHESNTLKFCCTRPYSWRGTISVKQAKKLGSSWGQDLFPCLFVRLDSSKTHLCFASLFSPSLAVATSPTAA